jgi:hypothetical protein
MPHRRPWWIGVRVLDISGIQHLFAGGIAMIGSFSDQGFAGFSVEQETFRRFNHNNFENEELLDATMIRLVNRVKDTDSDAHFLFQDQLCFSRHPEFWSICAYNNAPELIGFLNHKGIARSLFGRHVPSIGSTMMFTNELSFDNLVAKFPKSRKFVVQAPDSAGGHGTLLVDSQRSLAFADQLGTSYVVVSEYRERMAPMNSHVLVFSDRAITCVGTIALQRR